MVLIKHDKGGVSLPAYDLFFAKGEAVEVENDAIAEKILRNPAFSVADGSTKVAKKKVKKEVTIEESGK